MATQTRITKQVICTYTAVVQVKDATQQKLDGLLGCQGAYTVFEHDNTHPYYSLASSGSDLLAYYKDLIGGLKGWKIGSGTLEDELDKLRAWEIVNDTEPDAALDALRLITPKRTTAVKVAENILQVISSASLVLDNADNRYVKWQLEQRHGKRYVRRHLEVPLLNISPTCRAAVKEVKKLGKMLRGLVRGKTTIKRELEKMQVTRGLQGKAEDRDIAFLLKP